MTDVLVVYFQEFITVKILKFFGKIPTGTDTSVRTDPKPKHFNAEELQELEKAVREAALYLLNIVNKESAPLEKDYRARKKAEKTNQAQTGIPTDKEDKPGRRKKKVKNDPFTSTTDHLNDISTSRTKNISNEDEGMNQLEDTTVVAPRKKAEKRKSKTKNERNVDIDDSTSSQVSSSSNASSDSELLLADGHENSAVVASQKKAVKKSGKAKNQRKQGTDGSTTSRTKNISNEDEGMNQLEDISVVAPQKKAARKNGKAKNQRKQDTDESTTLNSNIHAEETLNGSNMDITSASLLRFNQFPCFESSSDNSGPNSIPPWFWCLFSLILLHNHSNSPTVNIYNYTDLSHRTSQRIKGKGNKNYHELSSLHAPLKLNNKIKKRIDTEVNFELSDLMDLG